MNWTRREFMGRGLAGLLASAAAPGMAAAQAQPALPVARGAALLCSRGEQWARKVHAPAWALLGGGGASLDAVIAGANVVELDPEDSSVGYGGLPNEEGVVQLDASVMSGKLRKSGAVGALERIKTPSSVARLVLERTDHVMLVGEGALRFARAHGFAEENLLTEASRLRWLKWKENLSPEDDWLPPADGIYRDKAGRPSGTINVLAVDAAGDLAGCTTTSGLAFKIPGRVGDSPIVGAGLYVDNEVGAAPRWRGRLRRHAGAQVEAARGIAPDRVRFPGDRRLLPLRTSRAGEAVAGGARRARIATAPRRDSRPCSRGIARACCRLRRTTAARRGPSR